MLHLTTTTKDNVMLKKADIILIKSVGSGKTKIFLRGVSEELMIDASFEEIKFAMNKGVLENSAAPPLKIAQ